MLPAFFFRDSTLVAAGMTTRKELLPSLGGFVQGHQQGAEIDQFAFFAMNAAYPCRSLWMVRVGPTWRCR